jgi:hypothetical protein
VFKNLLSECIIAACDTLDETRLQKLFDNGATLHPTSPYLPDNRVAILLMEKKRTELEIKWAQQLINKVQYKKANPHADMEIIDKFYISMAENILREKDNSEAQISAILKILINNGLDVNYNIKSFSLLNIAFMRAEKEKFLSLNNDGTYVNSFIVKILIDSGAKITKGENIMIDRFPELKEYYEKAQRTSQVNPATMHTARFTMSAFGLPQVAGKRTRRRGRSRKSQRRLRS